MAHKMKEYHDCAGISLKLVCLWGLLWSVGCSVENRVHGLMKKCLCIMELDVHSAMFPEVDISEHHKVSFCWINSIQHVFFIGLWTFHCLKKVFHARVILENS